LSRSSKKTQQHTINKNL